MPRDISIMVRDHGSRVFCITGIEPKNNRAEQFIGEYVVIKKITGAFQSESGA